ncbi:formimidoylglutamase (plasmid) [Streptomyces sp. AHU1]|uniref:formimidoylglutamase n=1 Tax=Streptomyces sp. AHU1 TaxID=3377215 RepID=UPI00387833A5
MDHTVTVAADAAPKSWSGRDDGPGKDNLRWHHVVGTDAQHAEPCDAALVGFRSDEGVRRNKGRQGARNGPRALRDALSSLALPAAMRILDVGDIEVGDGNLEGGHQRLGAVITPLLDRRHPVLVLGGGHEVAYGSYLGLAHSRALREGSRLGVLNLDAHFDLRDDAQASSGTPFLQMSRNETQHGRQLNYWVLGVSQPSNTQRLFDTADALGVHYLQDVECRLLDLPRVDGFLDEFLDSCDVVHLSIDLDVLPAAVAPGVSAPAAYGVQMEVIEHACAKVAASGKLAVCDIAELNPDLDIDNRTARTGARLIHRILTSKSAPTLQE